MNILVIDIGGSHVKMLVTGEQEPRKFDSHKGLTPAELVAGVKEHTADWKYDAISVGYPGVVGADGPAAEPGNLGEGWVGFDFSAAFGRPVRVANDAVLQALGGYDGGRMLFLGLGTGLGSALVVERVVIPLELGGLHYRPGEMIWERLGKEGLETHGKEAWMAVLNETVDTLGKAFLADYVLLGGGNAAEVDPLPPGSRRGGNEDAFAGGFRLWEEYVEPHDRPPADVWRVVR